jgi:predicted MFS family arabinose efflux permease
MSGLLLGILLARTVSGFVGQAMGWRAVFVLAASLMVVTLLWLRTALPVVPPEGAKLPYGKLLASLGELIRTQPVLQECAFFGAMGFGAFSAFWTSLTFLLAAAPFHFGPNAAGLFGLVGAGGALAAGVVGRLSDRGHPRTASAVALSLLLTSWAVFFWGRQSLLGLVIGTLLLDVGTQGNHIACQTRVFGLVPSARSRLNTIYMTSYFVGGSLGSATGAWAWGAYGWSGVCAGGSSACLLALVAMGFHHKRQAKSGVSLVGQV